MLQTKIYNHLYIFASLFLSIYSQLILRWQVNLAGALPETTQGKATFVLHLLLNPWVLTGMVATFLSGIMWMLAMTKFEMSYAYPWMSLNYVIVIALSILFFSESLNIYKLAGSILIILGIIIISRGQ